MSATELSSRARRLSVPPRAKRPPRPLTEVETQTLHRIADCLIPEVGPNPKGSAAADFDVYLLVALGARRDAFDVIMAAVAGLTAVPDAQLRAALKRLWSEDRASFDPLSAVLAGAYFMTPMVKSLIGYPGQHRDPAPVELAADEIEELIEPVLERGHFYVSANGE